MAAKKRPTAKRIVDAPQVKQTAAQGNGRTAAGTTTGGNGKGTATGQRPSGQRPTGKPVSGSQAANPKQAAKDRSRTAAAQAPKRRIPWSTVGWIAGGAVVLIVGIVILIAATSSNNSTVNGTGRVPVPASVINEVTGVPTAALDSAGIGGQPANKTSSAGNAVAPIPAAQQHTAPLPPTNGKPTFFYYGGEFCPYCATERWSLIVALSRFGHFSGLQGMSSSAGDYAPNTQTFTFYHSTYSSPYIAFTPVETEDINKNPLDQPNAVQTKVLQTWDPSFSFPFIAIGGKYIGGLPNWLDPLLLHGLSRSDIAQDLSIPGNVAGTPLNANANYITAAICNVTGGKPGSVCTSKGVLAAQAEFKNLAPATPVK
jgi:hypothetical protein